MRDAGYFGPESISWKIFADPVAKLGGMAALLLQALNPNMMRVFYNTTRTHGDAEGRDERTGQYFDTVIFGDTTHADKAAQSVRRIHAHARWVDPKSGQELRADNPEWLAWTHNTFVYALLRACQQFGPEITPDEADRFIVEQHKAAELMGVTDSQYLPSTRIELKKYIDAQTDWLSLCVEAAEVTRGLRRPEFEGNPLKAWVGIVIQDGVLSLLPSWALLLYGVEGRPMNLRAAARTTKRIMSAARRSKTSEQWVAEVTHRVEDHPYRKTRQDMLSECLKILSPIACS